MPQAKLKEEKMDSGEAELHIASSFSVCSIMDAAAASPAAVPSPNPPAVPASPPSSRLPSTPVVIKQEPPSPVHVSSEPDPVDDLTHFAHSTTPELKPSCAAAPPPGTVTQSLSKFHLIFYVQVFFYIWMMAVLPETIKKMLKKV